MNLAVDVLVKDGIDQVKVQAMAKELGVARSSFYWFFSSVQDLYDQLLAYWLARNTGPIIERAMRPAATVTRAVLKEFGIVEFGFSATNSLRLEKSFGIWSREFTQGYTAGMTGMDRCQALRPACTSSPCVGTLELDPARRPRPVL